MSYYYDYILVRNFDTKFDIEKLNELLASVSGERFVRMWPDQKEIGPFTLHVYAAAVNHFGPDEMQKLTQQVETDNMRRVQLFYCSEHDDSIEEIPFHKVERI